MKLSRVVHTAAGNFAHPPGHGSTLSDNQTIGLLIAILAVGLGFRLVHFWFVADSAFPSIPLVHTESDMHAFWQWAQTIVAGDWLGRDTYHPYFKWMREMDSLEQWHLAWGGKHVYHQAPLYPYLLALVLSLQNAPAFALLVQLTLGALQPLVLFFLARRLFDARVGLVSAALTALYGPFIFFQTTLLRDWLPPIIEPLIVLAVLRARENGKAADWVVAGMVIGLGILTKETTLAVSIMALVWLVFQYGRAWRELRRAFVLIFTGLLVSLAPLFARNMAVGAPLLAISGQGAGNVAIGFVADMSPVGFSVPSDRAREISLQAGGGFWSTMVETFQAHKDNLGDLFAHELMKLRGIVDPFEVWNNTSYYYGVHISPLLGVSLGYDVVFPLGVAGIILLLPAWRRAGLFYCYVFAALAAQMATIVLARFRLALVPVLILGAAFFLVHLAATMHRRKIGRAAVLAGLVSFLSLTQQVLAPIAPDRMRTRPLDYLMASKVHASRNRFDLALLELARARDRAGHATPSVLEGHIRIDWAGHLLQHGDRDNARRQIQLAERVYAQASDTDGWHLYNLGVMYTRLGERERARTFLLEYTRLYPESPKVDEIRELLESWN